MTENDVGQKKHFEVTDALWELGFVAAVQAAIKLV